MKTGLARRIGDFANTIRLRRAGHRCRYRRLARRLPGGQRIFTCDHCNRTTHVRGSGRPTTCARMHEPGMIS